MWLIDFLYGGKKVSDIPLWALKWEMEDTYRKRRKEERRQREEELKRREWDRRLEESRRYNRLVDDYIMGVIEEVNAKRRYRD